MRDPQVPLRTIAREWTRIGCLGFGGPPAHIALLRSLCVDRLGWLAPGEFEDAIAAVNLLPGPASTQLAIFCAWRLRGARGALVGGLGFILPGLALIIVLAAALLAQGAPRWIAGAAAGAGAGVPAVALLAAAGLVPASWRRAGSRRAARVRWVAYAGLGAVASATVGADVVLVLLACGVVEVAVRRGWASRAGRPAVSARSDPSDPAQGDERPGAPAFVLLPSVGAAGILAGVAWVAFKVGALSYGGGFVIVPLMQHDAVDTYHWLSAADFLGAVALGQVTPGPVVQTVAAVGYAAAGLVGALLAALVAFGPSFVFVLGGARFFDRVRASPGAQAFLAGAGPAAIGAIAGSAIPLGLALVQPWQAAVLAGVAAWLFVARRGVVSALLGAGVAGAVLALAGLPLGR